MNARQHFDMMGCGNKSTEHMRLAPGSRWTLFAWIIVELLT
jgi:hypothetical protein